MTETAHPLPHLFSPLKSGELSSEGRERQARTACDAGTLASPPASGEETPEELFPHGRTFSGSARSPRQSPVQPERELEQLSRSLTVLAVNAVLSTGCGMRITRGPAKEGAGDLARVGRECPVRAAINLQRIPSGP